MGDEHFKPSRKSVSLASTDIVDWDDPKSITEYNKRMLVKQIACDVMFIVGDKGDIICAHKYVLISQSAVFKDMFTGPNAYKWEHRIPGISLDYFLQLLAHAYFRGEKLQVSNVVGVLNAADHFAMKNLRQSCLTFFHSCLQINNMFYLLGEVKKFGYKQEENIIMSFLAKVFEDVQKAIRIDDMPRQHQVMDLQLPDFDVDKLLKIGIREQFAHKPLKGEKKEKVSMDKQKSVKNADISSKSPVSSQTSAILEHVEQVTRLHGMCTTDYNNANRADAISFTVNKNIYLYGFSIYGPKNQGEAKYKVDTIVYCKNKDIFMDSIYVEGNDIFLPVMFKDPIRIDKNRLHTLEVYITGPESHIGTCGQEKIYYGSVLFTFSNAKNVKKNRTDATKGQIPQLYFSETLQHL